MDFDGFGSGDSSLAFGQMTLAFRPRNMPLQKANKDGEVLDENMDDGNQQDIEAPDHTLPAPPPQGASSEIGDKKDEKPVVTVNHGNGSRIQQRRACIARKIQKIMGLRPCVKGRGFYSQDILLFTELHLADPMLLWVDQERGSSALYILSGAESCTCLGSESLKRASITSYRQLPLSDLTLSDAKLRLKFLEWLGSAAEKVGGYRKREWSNKAFSEQVFKRFYVQLRGYVQEPTINARQNAEE